jgi:Short C-terminal domain
MPILRRRPVLRAAAVGGGAYYAGKRSAESRQREMDQEQRLSSMESESAAAPAAARAQPRAGGVSDEVIQRLAQLGQLHDQGVLTDDEFAAQKAKLLGA